MGGTEHRAYVDGWMDGCRIQPFKPTIASCLIRNLICIQSQIINSFIFINKTSQDCYKIKDCYKDPKITKLLQAHLLQISTALSTLIS